MTHSDLNNLEHEFARIEQVIQEDDGFTIEGYASFFDKSDQGKDIVQKGAYKKSLESLDAKSRTIKMLWQHDPMQPIGTWNIVKEDAKGLFVRGQLLPDVSKAQEAAALVKAGAIDGLSIGYRVIKATKNKEGQRLLHELDLWEVSLVTFPMLPEARVGSKSEGSEDATLLEIADAFSAAGKMLAL